MEVWGEGCGGVKVCESECHSVYNYAKVTTPFAATQFAMFVYFTTPEIRL